MAYISGRIEEENECNHDENGGNTEGLDLPTIEELLQVIQTHFEPLFMDSNTFDGRKLAAFNVNKIQYIKQSIQ